MSALFTILISFGMLFFVFDWFVDKTLNIRNNTISDYANGKFGYLTTCGFLIYGLSVCFSVLYLLPMQNIAFSVFKWIVFGYGTGIALLAVFRCNKAGETTLRGMFHNIFANVAMIGISLNMFYFFTISYLNGTFSTITLVLASINIVSAILFALSFKYIGNAGIWERICMFCQYIWIISEHI